MLIKKKFIFIGLALLLIIGSFFYFRNEVYYARGSYRSDVSFKINKGEGVVEITKRLKESDLISGNIYFYYYLKTHKLTNKIMSGTYLLSGKMTIPEIAYILSNPSRSFVKITFPEGFTAKLMADRLNANDLPGDNFLKIINNPGDFKKQYNYLSGDNIKTLEGYLFPDTYFFKKDAMAKGIVKKMLDVFSQKLSNQMIKDIASQNKSIADEIIMASIVEKEVQTPEDMKVVAGIFWKRIKNNHKLQSDATLSYVLDDNIDQHSNADLSTNSPYNTYLYVGLPPSPISNPGLDALRAAIYPTPSDYNYFLTATVNGAKKVIYSQTFQEHVANKAKYGL